MADKSLLDIIIRQKSSGKGAKDTEKDIGSLKKGFGNLEKAALGAGVALVGAFAAISLKSIQLAGDMEEMESKFDAVFKETAPEARAELEEFASVVNRSRFELMDMASSLQDTFVPLGFARDQAKDLSIQLTKLAVDVASFNNAQEPEVMAAFQSAIVGNHEAVRSYGIVITQASLNQELLNMGFDGGVQKADAQQKALARLNIIMGATSDAQGDAVKTADSFVNSMKGLKAQVEELQVAYGRQLLPVAREVVAWASADAEAWNLVNKALEGNTDGMATNIVSRYVLFRQVRDEVIQRRESEESWRDIEEAMASSDDKLRRLSDQSLPAVQTALEETVEPGRMAMETLQEFGNAAEITAGKVDTNLTGSITGFLEQVDFLLGGGAEIQAAFENLKTGVETGAISVEDGETWAEGLFVAAVNLQEEMGNIDALEAEKMIKEQLGGSLKDARSKLDGISKKFDSLNRTIEMEIIVSIGGPGAQLALGGPGGQHGLDMIVPGGFPNDTFPIRASSGERVTIAPAGPSQSFDQSRSILSGGSVSINNGLSSEAFDSMIQEWLRA